MDVHIDPAMELDLRRDMACLGNETPTEGCEKGWSCEKGTEKRFPKFNDFPKEIRWMIWNAAARPVDLNSGDVHFFQMKFGPPKHDGSLETPWWDTLEGQPEQSVYGLDNTALWKTCRESRAAMNFHFRTHEWWCDSDLWKNVPTNCNFDLLHQWEWLPAGSDLAASATMWVRPKTDLFVVQSDSAPRFASRQSQTSIHASFEYATYFPHRMLRQGLVADVSNLGFPVDCALEQVIHPAWVHGSDRAIMGTTDFTDSWLERLESVACGEPSSEGSKPQIWLMDPTLCSPKAWTPPAGRKRFHGTDFDLVEVELEDYGVRADQAQNLFLNVWLVRNLHALPSQWEHLKAPTLGPDFMAVAAAGHDTICRAAKELMAFQLATQLRDIARQTLGAWPFSEGTYQETGRMMANVKVLARVEPEGCKDPFLQRGERFASLAREVGLRKEVVKELTAWAKHRMTFESRGLSAPASARFHRHR